MKVSAELRPGPRVDQDQDLYTLVISVAGELVEGPFAVDVRIEGCREWTVRDSHRDLGHTPDDVVRLAFDTPSPYRAQWEIPLYLVGARDPRPVIRLHA